MIAVQPPICKSGVAPSLPLHQFNCCAVCACTAAPPMLVTTASAMVPAVRRFLRDMSLVPRLRARLKSQDIAIAVKDAVPLLICGQPTRTEVHRLFDEMGGD